MNILLVEDEIRLAQSLAQLLESHHFSVDIVHNGQDGFDYGLSDAYDVIILDVMLPKIDGFSLIKLLRQNNINTPVLFLSAKDGTSDKITGLNLGADDYLTKPFEPLELIARINALTRRKGEVIVDELSVIDLQLNMNNHTLTSPHGSLQLSQKEYQLMELFMTYPSQVFSKEHLINKVWGSDSEAIDNNVETYISFLRKKLDFLKSKAKIETIRKVGYYLGDTHD